MKYRFLIIAYILLNNTACMNNSIQYEYADGSANRYLLTETELQYVPVTPAESSTGTYSGGEPKTVLITPVQFNELKSLLDNALENSSIHITDRMKTSGMISKIGSGDKKQCILRPNCTEMKTIEATLKSILLR